MNIGGYAAKVYHKEQPKRPPRELVCSGCLETGHWFDDCPNDVTCRECHKSGHKRGDPACRAMEEEPVLPESVWEPFSGDPGLFLDSDGAAADGREDDDEWEASRSEVSTEVTNLQATEEMYLTPRDPVKGKRRDNNDTDDQGKKQEFVERGRSLIKFKQQNGKQTKLDFESRPRSATPKRSRSQAGVSPTSESVAEKHVRLTDTGRTRGSTFEIKANS